MHVAGLRRSQPGSAGHDGVMTIVPDTKDWTWVLERACPECGFDASQFAAVDVPDRIRADLPAWAVRLAERDARTRPDASTWSPLESRRTCGTCSGCSECGSG